MTKAEKLTDLIGNTPLLALNNLGRQLQLQCKLLAKLEYFNPAGSAKDRIALSMIEAAEAEGKLQPGSTIIEPTSGNTGIGLAAVAAVKGYKVILTMPDTMSQERRSLLKAYGAQLRPANLECRALSIKPANWLHRLKTPLSPVSLIIQIILPLITVPPVLKSGATQKARLRLLLPESALAAPFPVQAVI